MEQRTKRQHTVARSCLDRFTDKDGKLWCFDKVTKSEFQTTLTNIANEKGFYDLPGSAMKLAPPGLPHQIVEKHLANMEGWFKTNIDQLLATVEKKGISPEQRLAIAPFIVTQMLRTKEAREEQEQDMQKFAQASADAFVQEKFPELAGKVVSAFDKDQLKMGHIRLLVDEDFICDAAVMLVEHIWVIGSNTTTQPFYTSDHPVVKQAHITTPKGRLNGLRSSGIEIALPLSSRHILVLFERRHFKGMTWAENKLIRMSSFGIEYYNNLQAMQSYRHIFCEAREFEQVRGVCRRFPEVCLPDRQRTALPTNADLQRFIRQK